MESHREDLDLAAELRALRPTPRPAFAAGLDERAAAGFPRHARFTGSRPSRFAGRLRAIRPKRMLLPAAGTALAAIAVATVLVASSESGTRLNLDLSSQAPRKAAPANSAPQPAAPTRGSSGELLSGQVGSAAGKASAPAAIEPFAPSRPAAAGPGPYAANVTHRDVERSAQIVLGASASGVRSAAGKVFETVHEYDGIVLGSSIRDGGAGEAGATFDLLIPSGRLGDAMAAFSAIADVRSRHESTADVTAPTIGLGERLRDAHARVESLLTRLAGAGTEAEREAVEVKLRFARRYAAALQGRLAALQRRTHLSSVSLRIETGGDVSRNGGWGVGKALGDAGRILSVAAGVSLVGIAILVPPALLCLLAWLTRRAWIRRSRERALGAS